MPGRTGLLFRQQLTRVGMHGQTVPLLVMLPFMVPVTAIPLVCVVPSSLGMFRTSLGCRRIGLRKLLLTCWQTILIRCGFRAACT